MQRTIVVILNFVVGLSLTVPASLAQTRTNRPQPAQGAVDPGWPRGYNLPSEAQLVVY